MNKKTNRIKTAAAACLFAAAGIFYVCSSNSRTDGGVWESRQVRDNGQVRDNSREDLMNREGGGNLRENGDRFGNVSGDISVDISGIGESAGADGNGQEPVRPEEERGIWIHVCGEVLNPGVYELEAGSRVWQAVEVAGGFSKEADQDFLNMALTLEDGMKLVIPNQETARQMEMAAEDGIGAQDTAGALGASGISGAAGAAGTSGAGRTKMQAGIFPAENGRSGAGDGSASAKVNINTASKETLMTLKGIGSSRADDIIAYREANGPFRKIEDIMKVSGIKEASFEKIKEDITV